MKDDELEQAAEAVDNAILHYGSAMFDCGEHHGSDEDYKIITLSAARRKSEAAEAVMKLVEGVASRAITMDGLACMNVAQSAGRKLDNPSVKLMLNDLGL